MNEPNSTLQRLIHKLALLDVVDEQSGSGKLDLIIQLPYIIKTEARKKQANDRRDDIATQLRDSKYGIAYTDGTEKITQLNRPLENNLMKQVEYLTSMLFSQLGITESILNGTANEDVMLNYFSRTVKPIMDAIVDEMKRKFLTKTARTQLQTIMYFNDPFKLVTVTKLAEIADSLTRNEVMSSNEIRQVMGLRPVDDPRADELRNKNLNDPKIQNGTNSTQINCPAVPEQANEIPSRDDRLKQFIERRKKRRSKTKWLKKQFDFSGWATAYGIKCSDGRVIINDAFKENDGTTVPLVWMHEHSDVSNVLGHALLEHNEKKGMYAYCSFNNTDRGKHAKELVKNGDVVALSIYANKLVQKGNDVTHGSIREVSLVLSGANPGAYIDNVIVHGELSTEEATIF